jgi:hypothetical protein
VTSPFSGSVETLLALAPVDANLDPIDWADIAAKTRAQHGDEWVARFGDHLWQTMMVTAGVLSAHGAEGLKFGEPPPAA